MLRGKLIIFADFAAPRQLSGYKVFSESGVAIKIVKMMEGTCRETAHTVVLLIAERGKRSRRTIETRGRRKREQGRGAVVGKSECKRYPARGIEEEEGETQKQE